MRVKNEVQIELERKQAILAAIPPIIAKYEKAMAANPNYENDKYLTFWQGRHAAITQEIATLEAML